MPEYTLLAVVSVIAVIGLETRWLRTGIFGTLHYWVSVVIVMGFQIPVDGWLTKLSDPIVIYHSQQISGVRWPWDIPIEDFAFGYSMITLAILVWTSRSRPTEPDQEGVDRHRPRRPGAPEGHALESGRLLTHARHRPPDPSADRSIRRRARRSD